MSVRMCNFYVYVHSTQGEMDAGKSSRTYVTLGRQLLSIALYPSPTIVCTYVPEY